MNTTRMVVSAALVIAMSGCAKSVEPAAQGSSFVKCKDVPVTFTISLVNGAIKVDPNNGDAIHVDSHRVLRWTSAESLKLLFMLQEKKAGSEPGDLPVHKTKPETEDLCYRVGKKEYTMKYNIYVGSVKLDPTIIVDR